VSTEYVGVDWCSGSWLAVAYTADGYDHTEVFDEIGRLWTHYEETAERILADVPIGLRESGGQRPPEPLARGVLGPRNASVFTPPVREAARKQSYQAAKRVNERKADRGLSKQAHAISPGITQVDELLQAIDEARGVVREAHPEVCFRALAGEPLAHSKRTAAGYAERMRALAGFDRDTPPTVQSAAKATAGHEVRVDDVLDAVVLALTARPGPGELHTLPPDSPTDPKGLPMEMVYRAETPVGE